MLKLEYYEYQERGASPYIWCPHCFDEVPTIALPNFFDVGHIATITCTKCGNDFEVEGIPTLEFTTYKVGEER